MTSGNTTPGSRWSARQLALMAMFLALGTVLSFIEFPLLPGTDFLKYDAANVPALLIGFAYGPLAGCIVATLIPWLHSLFAGNPWGALMNTCIGIAYVLPSALIYRASRRLSRRDSSSETDSASQSKKMSGNLGLIIGLAIGCVLAVGMAMVMNLLVTPIYTGAPLAAIKAMILPILLPFNVLKVLLNSVLGFLLMKSLHSFMT